MWELGSLGPSVGPAINGEHYTPREFFARSFNFDQNLVKWIWIVGAYVCGHGFGRPNSETLYFTMPVERSAGIILFHNAPEGRRYLVIRSSYHGKDGKHNFWDFPKGLLEKGEKGIDAAKREAIEEAGIKDFEIIPEFKETVRYFARRSWEPKAVMKFVALFLAETKTVKVRLSWEHDAYEWLLLGGAKERLTMPQMKKALEAAEEFLKTYH